VQAYSTFFSFVIKRTTHSVGLMAYIFASNAKIQDYKRLFGSKCFRGRSN